MSLVPARDEQSRNLPPGSWSGFRSANVTGFKPTIILLDDRTLARECLLHALLREVGGSAKIEACASFEDFAAEDHARVSLLILRVHGKSPDVLRAQIASLAKYSVQTLVITSNKVTDLDLSFSDLLHSGVCGLVSESDSDPKLLGAAIKFTLCGGKVFPVEFAPRESTVKSVSRVAKARGGFTVRQAEVFAKMREGKPNKIIAFELGISQSTTKVHIHAILRILGATNRTQAVALRHNELDPASTCNRA